MKIYIFFFAALIASSRSLSQKTIRSESIQSLYVEVYKDNMRLGSATGFLIRSKTRPYLITNYHVVTNKNSWDGNWINPQIPISPNKILINQNGKEIGSHLAKVESLISSRGDTLWHRNKIGNEMVDVIELPLTDTSNIVIYSVDYQNTTDSLQISPTDRVFIPGFPLGLRASNDLAIWKSGFIASEPDLDQEDKPIIWLDETPFPGMSGSPVYYISKDLNYKNGTPWLGFYSQSFFMGVFAHGNVKGVYGALWKASFLKKIFDALP